MGQLHGTWGGLAINHYYKTNEDGNMEHFFLGIIGVNS